MRDISPSQREVLERASQHVKIFERLPKDAEVKDVLFGLGCFDCSHTVGSMDTTKPYTTIEITAMDENYYESNGDPGLWNRVAFTASLYDNFWGKTGSPLRPLLDSGGMWPSVYKYYYTLELLEDYPECYVRLISYGGAPAQHVNKKVNVMDYFTQRDVSLGAEILVSITPSSYNQGAYVDPSLPLTGTDVIDAESIHLYSPSHMLHTILNDSFGGKNKNINLKRIYAPKEKLDEKLVKIKGKANFPPLTTWAGTYEELVNANHDFPFNPPQQGDS